MKTCFIFSYFKDVLVQDKGNQTQNHLILFFPYKGVEKYNSDIQVQLRDYFHDNILPDKLIVICLQFNRIEIGKLFEKDSPIYQFIPKFDYNNNEKSIHVVSLNKNGEFESIIGSVPSIELMDEIYNRGMSNIFQKNGGLIIAQSSNHFVFPSGKHSNKFLRTGNVLITGTEILFIASSLVRYFKRDKFESIYSDTSSINSLVYAYINLLKELNPKFKESVYVESFGSYKMFEKQKFQAKRDSLFLISSSTSGSIIERMTKEANKAKNIILNNIAIIYGLDVKSPYNLQVICDLTFNEKDPTSLLPFESYNINKSEICRFCNDEGSKPIKVEGDVFLLEKPIVTAHLIYKTDLPRYLINFSNYYNKLNKDSEPIIRCYYKDDAYKDKKYDIYIDIATVLNEWDNRTSGHYFEPIFAKLEKYILQNVPASLKYMIVLPDEGSSKLASIICKILNEQGIIFKEENILTINSDDFQKIESTSKGTILVVSSSIVTGRNLLYLSRALRDFEGNYSKMYFTFINRTGNAKHLEFLQSNLGLGEFGVNTHKIFNVESIHCSSQAQNTPWHIEENEIKKFQEFFEDYNSYTKIIQYCDERILELTECGKNKGLSNNLFFPSLKSEVLKIKNGFAFSPFQSGEAHSKFIVESKQSEIYYIISTILNEKRNKGLFVQGEYVKNILDPGNFVRYNDGIIQSCILRAATNDELNYSISEEASLQMKSILGDMILHLNDDHAEALNEFFYAIAIKKMKLTPGTIEDCIQLLHEQSIYVDNDSILKGIIKYIEDNVLPKETFTYKFSKVQINN